MPREYMKHSERAGRHGTGPMGHPGAAVGSQAESCRVSWMALDAGSERNEEPWSLCSLSWFGGLCTMSWHTQFHLPTLFYIW